MAEAGLAEAAKLGLKVTIAFTDVGGHPILLQKMDGAMPVAGELAIGKARSATLFARSTSLLEGASNAKDGKARTALISSGHVMMEGGLPIIDPAHGAIVGACGVSGATPDQDAAVAKAALAALGGASKL